MSMHSESKRVILGGGITGLAAGIASGFPVFEAAQQPGGICSSYYMRRGDRNRLTESPSEGDAYRFEHGGGHWIFGGDPLVLQFIDSLVPFRSYQRRSSVFFPDRELYVPYPLQNHLSCLGKETAVKALAEMMSGSQKPPSTMQEGLEQSFGPTLLNLFFGPFHDLYTAGLWKRIKPQDGYKSPHNLQLVLQGAFGDAPPVGYNVTFVYPADGLNALASNMASRCDLRFGKSVARVDVNAKEILFVDGGKVSYDRLISTLPLNHMCKMAGISLGMEPDPYSSVLVINVGGIKGLRCPPDHWIYVPSSEAGFHRVGFYSNVDESFIPKNGASSRVSIYVEKAYPGGERPSETEMASTCEATVQELRSWGYLQEAEVVDPTWIDVAYTWSWPGSTWVSKAISALQKHGIHQVGRYARWTFQGIADSIRDGFIAGTALRNS